MNNTFDFTRFGKYLKRKWLEFGKIYLLTILLAGAAIAIIYFFILLGFYKNNYASLGTDLRFRFPLFLIFGFLYASITASTYFADLGEKPRAIFQIMAPVSQFEKWLTGIIFAVIVPVISYVIMFNVVDMAFIKHLNTEVTGLIAPNMPEKMAPLKFQTFYEALNNINGWQWLIDFPFLLASIFLLGSVYFNRFHYVKTLVTLILFAIVAGYIFYLIGSHFFDDKVYIGSNPVSAFDLHRTEVMFPTIFAASTLLNIAVCIITYIRLKEKEV